MRGPRLQRTLRMSQPRGSSFSRLRPPISAW